jgi:RNA polymerase sigma-70 factor (ECF subfamily)
VDKANRTSEEEYRHWCDGLRPGCGRRDETVAELRQLLLRVARRELGRRRHQLGQVGGPELEDLAEQSANDAALKVIAKLDEFRRASRFTTWAIKFAIFEVSAQVARHDWSKRPSHADATWDTIPDSCTPGPQQRAEEREALAILSRAVRTKT